MYICFKISYTFPLDFAELGDIGHRVDVLVIERIEHVISGIDIWIAFNGLLLVARC